MSKVDPVINAVRALRRHEASRPMLAELDAYIAKLQKLSTNLDAANSTTAHGVALLVKEAAACSAGVAWKLDAKLRAASRRFVAEGWSPSAVGQLRDVRYTAAMLAETLPEWDSAACLANLAKALAAAEHIGGTSGLPTAGTA